jgi:hypothetical protein
MLPTPTTPTFRPIGSRLLLCAHAFELKSGQV